MFRKNGKVVEGIRSTAEDQVQDYFYFLKLVPHEFMDFIK
jgi:hypothetical protein